MLFSASRVILSRLLQEQGQIRERHQSWKVLDINFNNCNNNRSYHLQHCSTYCLLPAVIRLAAQSSTSNSRQVQPKLQDNTHAAGMSRSSACVCCHLLRLGCNRSVGLSILCARADVQVISGQWRHVRELVDVWSRRTGTGFRTTCGRTGGSCLRAVWRNRNAQTCRT